MLTSETLDSARLDLAKQTGYGISMPVAGLIYWLSLGISGYYLNNYLWNLVACYSSGLLFPLALLLAKPLKANLLVKGHPLTNLSGLAVLSINLLWPLHLAIFFYAPELLPLSLAIGMALHWPIFSWLYSSRACLMHALIRVPLVSAIWFLLPQGRLTLLPLAVAGVYALSIFQMKRELAVKLTQRT